MSPKKQARKAACNTAANKKRSRGTLASGIPAAHLPREMIEIGEGRRGGGLDISVDRRV